MHNHPVLSRMGIARRAGLLAVGTEKVTAAVKSGRAHLIILASDISPKTEKELRFLTKGKTEMMRIEADLSAMSAAIGIRAGVAAVTDNGLAQAIRKAGMLNDKI
ncbi:MAG: ribosomal L7Ae/L30e/S12e/Gadd45 family protein [Clostridia bacterium]|nr:ribosomal L7Ae/L30e/S12e/Gadd45 family protein [Clostridia bacterium]